MKETLIKWYPPSGLNSCHWVEDMGYEENGLFLDLYPDNEKEPNKAVLHFEHGVKAYRYTYESYGFDLYDNYLFGKNKNKPKEPWWYFKVKNSEYIKLLSQQTSNVNYNKLTHFVIIGQDQIIDIVAAEEPKITFTKITTKKILWS